AASYLTFVAIIGTDPLLPVAGQPDLTLTDLAGAAAVGVLAGVFARLFVVLLRTAKALAGRAANLWLRAGLAGTVLAGLFLLGRGLTGENLTLGAGYDSLRWALEPERSVGIIVA